MVVAKLLKQSFGDIIDEGYTAELEEKLDNIEEGRVEWKTAIHDFSIKFNADLERAATEMTEVKRTGAETDETCENGGSPMSIKLGPFPQFLASPNSPTRHTPQPTP